ncbi:MAG TPA: M14 family metallopeptidase [Polyangiaceae bacterium]|nr:M14 family metallopeptidase [Polyangiaceae bacterium]
MPPLTRAESSGYTETSLHADVLAFLAALDHPHLSRGTFGASPEGRELPLLVLSAKGVRTPDEARAAGLPVVLVINGIHAGEVEGKEASLMLVRDLLAGRHAGLLEKLTLVVVPLFNPDGNDRIDPKNRALDVAHFSGQLGPAKGVGTRVNASGVNLNRDYLRHESAEMRQLHRGVYLAWSPDLTIDCHATNGSVHRFHLTYDTPHTIESGRPEPIRFMREQFCPELTRRVRAGSGRETFFYGNFVEDEGGQGEGWMTYTHHPRFGSNYRGLTGRCDLLFECYSYISFEERVKTTYQLLEEALQIAAERGDDLRRVVAEAQTPRERVAVRYGLEAEAAPARVLTRSPRTLEGAPVEVVIPHLARFVGTAVVDRPWAYAVTEDVGRHLARHGLAVHQLSVPVEAAVEAPVIEEVRETDSRSILEAPGELRLVARLERRTQTLPAGTWLVETAQPLGAVAVYLCEAESDDGLVAAGLLTKPAPGDKYPALRVLEPLRVGA